MLVYVFLEFLRDAVRIRIAVRLEMYVFPVYGEAYLYYGDTISGIGTIPERGCNERRNWTMMPEKRMFVGIMSHSWIIILISYN